MAGADSASAVGCKSGVFVPGGCALVAQARWRSSGGGGNLCLGKLLAVVLGPPGLVGASMQEGCGYTADATCE